MSTSDYEAKLRARLLDIFKGEAREHVDEVSSMLIKMKQGEGDVLKSAVETAFRRVHSLKSAAQAVGRREMSMVCQSMESLFSVLKAGRLPVTPVVLDALQQANDGLDDYLATIDSPPGVEDQRRASRLVATLKQALKPGPTPAAEPGSPPDAPVSAKPLPVAPPRISEAPLPPAPPADEPSRLEIPSAADIPPAAAEPAPAIEAVTPPIPQANSAPPASVAAAPATIRLPVQRLEALMLESEGMIVSKLAARELASALTDSATLYANWTDEWNKARSAVHVLQQLAHAEQAGNAESSRAAQAMRSVLNFLDWNENSVRAMEASLLQNGRNAQIEARSLGSNVDRLLQGVKQVLMQQCGTMLQALTRVVRELARDQGKSVNLVLAGTTLEMDRRILEALHEPLLHLVRNCVDHGIEKPELRVAAGKPNTATVTIAVSQKDGDKVEFVVSDDGGGIATAKVVAAAIKQGILRSDQVAALSEEGLLSLIFQSGISTSPLITDVSGRGLGMAIVAETLENLGGSIAVESRPGAGTTFRLIVPLTLATMRGVCVRVSHSIFVIPTLALNRVISAERTTIATVENRPVMLVDAKPVMLVRLRDVLGLTEPSVGAPGDKLFAVVLGAAERRVAFEVDEILGDQEILIKPLGRYLVRVPNVLGAAVLGSGKVAPVLNASDLLKSAAKASSVRPVDDGLLGEAAMPGDKAVLVVEDSITARSLLKNILEVAGYQVTTAVDGIDAWSALKLGPFQLVVSDVEMPRMNGFDLTARIRADRQLAEIPVLLLTALESREDRERGVDVGANAYIVKSDFDQERLLEVVARLI